MANGCVNCPHSGSIIDGYKDCPDAYTNIAKYCGFYDTTKDRIEPLQYDDCEQFVVQCVCGHYMDSRTFNGQCEKCGLHLKT